MEKTPKPASGGSSSYYKAYVEHPTTLDEPYQVECNDIIETLSLTFAEANIVKAIWRTASKRMGNGKASASDVYDAEKISFFADRLLVKAHADNKGED